MKCRWRSSLTVDLSLAGTKEWTRVKTIGPNPEGRYGHAAAMVGSKFFIFGGQKDDGGFMNDLVWFDLQKREFSGLF